MVGALVTAGLFPKNPSANIPKMSKNFVFNKAHYRWYTSITQWVEEDIHPIYPYCLLTDLHMKLVSSRGFPYSAFGFLHRQEIIEVLSPLHPGRWEMTSELLNLEEREEDINFTIQTQLLIDGVLCWKSNTFAIKKKIKRQTPPTSKEHIDVTPMIKSAIQIKSGLAFQYGVLSFNLDPIHLHAMTAKMMGYSANIMHGMWGAACSLSQYAKDQPLAKTQVRFAIKFISPMFLPTKVHYYSDSGKGITGFYNKEKQRPHFIVQID